MSIFVAYTKDRVEAFTKPFGSLATDKKETYERVYHVANAVLWWANSLEGVFVKDKFVGEFADKIVEYGSPGWELYYAFMNFVAFFIPYWLVFGRGSKLALLLAVGFHLYFLNMNRGNLVHALGVEPVNGAVVSVDIIDAASNLISMLLILRLFGFAWKAGQPLL